MGVGLALLAWPARAHDLGVDLDGTFSAGTADAPRLGSAGATVSGGFDFGEALSLFAAFSYHRELPTRTADIAAGGGDIFQVSVGALWFADNGLNALLGFQLSPPSAIRSATTLRLVNRATGAPVALPGVVANTTTVVGVTVGGGLATATSLLSAQLTATQFELGQRFEVPPTLVGDATAAFCVENPAAKPCPLVNGKAAALWQVRVGLSYAATFDVVSLGAEGAAYFFDSDPAAIGFFSVAVLERTADASSGASAALLVTLKPFVGLKLGRFALRLSYQLGAYAAGQGLGHQLTLRTTASVSEAVRLTLSVSGQVDTGTGAAGAFGGSAFAGAAWVF